jgi:hypothetical protein
MENGTLILLPPFVVMASVYYLFFEESRAAILKGKATADKAKANTLNMLESILASFIAGSRAPPPPPLNY